MKTNEEYLENPGNCPFCNSDQIEGDSWDFDGDPSQPIYCTDCKSEWHDLYKLVGFDPIERS